MRITYQKSMNAFLQDMKRLQEDIYRSQQVISDGVEIKKPSDDPVRSRKVMELNEQLTRLDQFEDNISQNRSRLQHAESELQFASDLMAEARALSIQGSNGTLTDEDRESIAVRIDQILHEYVSIANARHGNTYLFGGYNTKEAPYQLVTDQVTGEVIKVQDLPRGMDGAIYTIVGEGQKVQTNIPGTDVFQWGEPATEEDSFQVLIDLRDGLRDNDIESVQGTIDRIDDSLDRVRAVIGRTGGVVRLLQDTSDRVADKKINNTDQLSRNRDADLAEWIKTYELQQIALQTTMHIGTQVVSFSLLNFI